MGLGNCFSWSLRHYVLVLTLGLAGACNNESSTDPDDGDEAQASSCDDVCAHAAALCDLEPHDDCSAYCEENLSAADRRCVLSADACTDIDVCAEASSGQEDGTGTDTGSYGDGDGIDEEPGHVGSVITTPQELLSAWDAFVAETRAAAEEASVTVDFWQYRTTINGTVVYNEDMAGAASDAREAIAQQVFSPADSVDVYFGAGSLNADTGQFYVWRTQTFHPIDVP